MSTVDAAEAFEGAEAEPQLTPASPRELKRLGLVDLSDRRNQVLAALRRRWRNRPPPGFVVAAGVTVSAPAVAKLLGTVARLPRGHIVLPALDLDMPEPEWESLGPDGHGPRSAAPETHPQHHLRLLLDRMGELMRKDYDWRAEIAALPMPALLLFADHDAVSTRHIAEFFALFGGGVRDAGWDDRPQFSRARLAIVPGYTHYNFGQGPDVARLIDAYLDRPTSVATQFEP